MQIPMTEDQFAALSTRAKQQRIELADRAGTIRQMGVNASWASMAPCSPSIS